MGYCYRLGVTFFKRNEKVEYARREKEQACRRKKGEQLEFDFEGDFGRHLEAIGL